MQSQRVVRDPRKQELSKLEENFRTFILPHLNGKDLEDYDLIWGWEKFVYDKGQRILQSERD